MNNVKSTSYTLWDESGKWLGQVVLTDDGMFAAVTDYGNLSYAWRRFGPHSFKEFICQLDVPYFGTKLFAGMAYIVHTKAVNKACQRFAEKILPALQAVLREEIANGTAEKG